MVPNFNDMTLKELRQYAQDNNIDVSSGKKKADVIILLNNSMNSEEDVKMEENTNVMNEEMEVNETVDTNVEGGSTTAEDKRVWVDNEGNEVSMSQFIREKFTKDNLSRKEIADKFDINYRTVYGATVNMTNDAEPASRGRGVVNPKIKVTADNKVLVEKVEGEGDAAVTKYFLNGEELVAGESGALEIPETIETDRNSWIKDQVNAGVNRGDIAKILDISYGVVYGLTKDEESSRQKYEVELPDGSKMARSEYIRMRVAEGVSKADVAKELGVEYSVVWQATKKDKTDAEKYASLVEQLEKMTDKVSDQEGFATAIELLKGFTIVEKEEAATDVEATAEVTETTEA